MKLNNIQTFITVVESGNFSKAAEILEVSSVAVSKQIKLLEQNLDVTLFERNTRKMEITDIGKNLYEQFSQVLKSIDDIAAFTRAEAKVVADTLSIVAPASLTDAYLAPILVEFAHVHPEINFQLSISDHMPDFSHKKADIAIGYTKGAAADQIGKLVIQPLMSYTRQLCASKSYLKILAPLSQ